MNYIIICLRINEDKRIELVNGDLVLQYNLSSKSKKKVDEVMKKDFGKSIERLLDGIKSDYAKWSLHSKDDDDRMKQIKLKMIDEFNQGVKVKFGRKYTKVLQGSSVWGFIANDDGVLKGIPYKKGDVFKAAGWRAPAKWQRGSIFDSGTNWFRWTGPRYL